ncbi:alpha-amylase family glycosyl hydrolase [Rubrivirga sp.]|uniref:alpha-amylase family glycosyl hydrolase n=1 Tax=Rubrivirga sp. TaxID=1885344 RepID=UPI003B52F9E9
MTRPLGLLVFALAGLGAHAQSVALLPLDAEVWGRSQTVRGTVTGATAGTLHVGDQAVAFEAADGTFAVPVTVGEGTTEIVACAGSVCSDTLRYTLGYRLRPEVALAATVEGETVTFAARVLDNPGRGPLAFAWSEDPGNPASLGLSVLTDTTATASLATDAPAGEYYVDIVVTQADGDARRARTLVTVEDGAVRAFDIARDHAAWIDRAVLYEITPRFFVNQYNGKLRHITDKIPELVDLGIDTIWLQPIFPTANGQQAYDVTDYFAVWDDLGTEDDLHELIDTAHAAGLRVILDVVPNHTSISHPYAEQVIAHGDRSYYADFYQQETDDAPYSENYTFIREGEATFIGYFWDDLVNLNYDNPDVQRFMVEATRYWVETFDVDGFRFDAVWAVVARNPAFVQEWRRALKRVKPELLLLAETKATDPASFEGFDVAYDWHADRTYISKWAWQRSSPDVTLFNTGLDQFRARDLRNAVTNRGNGYPPGAAVLRYLENNDTPRFVANHSVEQTKMAATLVFTLPGVPMLYYGQEVGIRNEFPSFPVSVPIRDYDREGFFAFYQHLIWLKHTLDALEGDGFQEVQVTPGDAAGQTYAYLRTGDDADVLAVANLGEAPVAAIVSVPTVLEPSEAVVLTDLFTGEIREVSAADLDGLALEVPGHTTRLLAVADRAIVLPVASEPDDVSSRASLEPSYPNPTTGRSAVPYTLSRPGHVRLSVFDVLGREVAVLEDGFAPAGRHAAPFDATPLPSGTYVVRLDAESVVLSTMITVIR